MLMLQFILDVLKDIGYTLNNIMIDDGISLLGLYIGTTVIGIFIWWLRGQANRETSSIKVNGKIQNSTQKSQINNRLDSISRMGRK